MNSKEDLLKYWKHLNVIKDKKILDAFKKVKREQFISNELKVHAYGDYPVTIPGEQTISQPTTVMLMTQALEVKPGMKILEVGSGSGYQAAILSRLVGTKGKIISAEIIPELVLYARDNLEKAKIQNVEVVLTDGSIGYKKKAPYDRIIITAACPSVPKPLLDQLKKGGILIAPVGERSSQQLLKVRKEKEGVKVESLGGFVFVPLKGKHGFN